MLNREGLPKPAVLIVEIQTEPTADTHSWIRELGFNVVGRVNSVEEAIKAAVSSSPDMVFVFYSPSGIEDRLTLAKLMAPGFKIPFIFLPAGADEDILSRPFIASAGYAPGEEFPDRDLDNYDRGKPPTKLTEQGNAKVKPAPASWQGADKELKAELKAAREALARETKRRKEADLAWRNSEKLLADLIKEAPLAVELYNPDGRRVAISNALGDIWSGLEEIKGEFNILTDEQVRNMPFYASIVQAFQGREAFVQEWTLPQDSRHNSQERITINSRSKAIRDEDGQLINIVMFHEDITVRTNLESKLRQAQKMESLGRMAGGVAHDLNNILQGIVAIPEILLMKLPEDNPHREYLKIMHDSGTRATEVIQDLLTLARKTGQAREVVNLNDILYNFMISREYLLLKKNYPLLTFQINTFDHLPNITGSENLLLKATTILIQNAAQAISGPGTVTVSLTKRHIDQPPGAPDHPVMGDWAVLTVKDTGEPLASEDLERIFEPFYTTKKMGRGGTGLGLALVWGAVKDNQGYIEVKSEPDQGTTFELYFPAARDAIPAKT